MRRAWKRYWRLGSAMAAVIAMTLALSDASTRAASQRHNELTLAGLRPGVSKLRIKETKMRGFDLPPIADATGVHWNLCDGLMLHVEPSINRTVQTVTVSLFGARAGDCRGGNEDAPRKELRSGRGLVLGDTCARVNELYGEPESRSPSVRGPRKLELLFYSFDWAGDDVPQSMEVSCDQETHQVVEITLASSTL